LQPVKRILVLIIALVYLAVSSGFTVHMHYCMGHFVSAAFVDDEQDIHECGHCGMKKKKGANGCCKDEHKIVKNDTGHSPAKEIKAPSAPVEYLLPVASFIYPANTEAVSVAIVHSFRAHAPPDPYDCPLYLKIRNLRI
jgi:hypothetical protein